MKSKNNKETKAAPNMTNTPEPLPIPMPEPLPVPKPGPEVGGIVKKAMVILFLIVAGAVCFWVWKRPHPPADPVLEDVPVQEPAQVDPDELFAELDGMLAEGKRLADVDAETLNAMQILDDVIRQLVQKAEEAGDSGLAAGRVEDAYSAYVSAVYRHTDLLDGQTLSGAIYKQIMIEYDEAVSLGNSLTEKGYGVETGSLLTEREAFKTSYTDKLINTFDELTERAMWSRTEAWNLMSETAGNMFEPSDLDNPVRLRYAYALSWWVQKQIETELNNGTITKKGAAIKIANMIDIMDYNPMMIDIYITFMNESGEDCTEVSNAYNEIVEHLYQTQGIRIGKDIDLNHFWYFNDFITHPVDDRNGVTQENRQWIRGRMGYVTFVKE